MIKSAMALPTILLVLSVDDSVYILNIENFSAGVRMSLIDETYKSVCIAHVCSSCANYFFVFCECVLHKSKIDSRATGKLRQQILNNT